MKTVVLSRINLVLDHCFKFAREDDLSNVARAAYEKFNTMT